MLKKVTSSDVDVNMDRHYSLECGHNGVIRFEELRGNAARRMPNLGVQFECALCGPDPKPILKDNGGTLEPKKGMAPKPNVDLTMPDSRPLDVKLKEYFGVAKMESKLSRIKAILEEK